ncbi:MAG: ROK family protein [Clostridiaceae bacterium]|nr:ROK family protein [Clostridiaceae bacterium]
MNTSKVKQLNTNLIRTVLKDKPGKTKADIAVATGLSQATCNTILNELVLTGEVLVLEEEAFSGGRPAKRFMYNGDYGTVICLYADNDSNRPTVSYAVVNLLGVIKEEKTFYKTSIDYFTIEELIGNLISKYKNVKAAAIGIPGVVIQGRIISTCDIKGLSDCPLSEKLQEKFDIPVTLENDMNVIALGYYQGKDHTGKTSVVVLSFIKDNCPGAGIIVDGYIVRGHTNFAGEISYLPFGNKAENLKDRKEIIDKITKTICSITAVINPETILITGTSVTEDMMNDIRENCLNFVPELHIPNIVYQADTHEYYINGLMTMAFDSLIINSYAS